MLRSRWAAVSVLLAACLTLVGGAGSAHAAWPAVTSYRNIVSNHSGKCVTAGAFTNAPANQYTCQNSVSQQWTASTTDNGFVTFQVANTGQCLEVANSSQANNAPLRAAECNGAFNQQWFQQWDGSITARHSGKCLSIQSESLLNFAKIVQYTCDGGFAEFWHLA